MIKVNKNEITIDDKTCFMCGKPFEKNIKGRRTFHHAIPKRYNPIRNLKIPIHQSCHYLLNESDNIYKKYYLALKARFDKINKMIQEKLKQ